jgi:DHA1 family bicyclomycin/chloramphenicol resistance-like MFS transporter
MVLMTIILMDLLTGMEFDLFVPSFPQLQHHFGLTPFWVEALLSVNFIGYCLSLFFVGGLADRYGRKPIILLGLMAFVVGSMLCLYPGSYFFIFMGRFLQGVGVAAPAILSFLIIADHYPLKEQQFLMAMLNGSLNTAAALAPVIGSYLTLYFHWQGNFMALFILGFVVLLMTSFFIPSYQLPSHKETSSLRGYFLIFQSKPLMLLITSIVFMCVPYWIFVGTSSLLYIKDLGVSLSHFGYYQGILAFVFAVGSVIYGLMIKNNDYNQKKMLVITIQIFMASFILMTWLAVTNSANPLWITVSILIFVIGQIIPSTILYPLSLNFMPQAKGRVSAIIQGGRLIFTALALQITGYFYQGSFRNIGVLIIMFIVSFWEKNPALSARRFN